MDENVDPYENVMASHAILLLWNFAKYRKSHSVECIKIDHSALQKPLWTFKIKQKSFVLDYFK